MLATILIIVGVILMLARGTGWLNFPKWPTLDVGWIGAALVVIGVVLLKGG